MTLKTELNGWQGSQKTLITQLVNSVEPESWLNSEGQHRARFRFAREFVRGKDVLDAGCGGGYGSMILLKGGAKSVTGVDISEESITGANSHFAAPNLRYIMGDLHRLPFPESSFDVIVAFEIIDQVPDFIQVLQEFKRLLRPGGVLLISTPNRVVSTELEKTSNPYQRREFSPNELVEMLSTYFRPPFQIFGQFVRQTFGAKATFHIPSITESLSHCKNKEEGNPVLSGNNYAPASRHACPTEDDFIFAEQRLVEAPTLVAICHC
jgi:ubiquinone/menaquinone biosynthesis C-methylase UbiE